MKRNYDTTEHPILLQDEFARKHPCLTCKFYNHHYCEKYKNHIKNDERIQKAYMDNDCEYYRHYATDVKASL